MITAENLAYCYPGQQVSHSMLSSNKPLLNSIDISIGAGEILAIMGPNGSGKTTLLRLLSKILTPTVGCVKYEEGLTVSTYINFFDGGITGITVKDYIFLKSLYRCQPELANVSHVYKVLEIAGLDVSPAMRFSTLSSGQQMRINFGYVLSDDSDVIIMDEWLSVGDKDYRKRVKPLLDEFIHDKSRALIFATHDEFLADEIATKKLTLV